MRAENRLRSLCALMLLLFGGVGFGLLVSEEAHPHAFAPSLLAVEETSEGRVAVRWKQPVKRVSGSALRPVFPEGCEPVEGAHSYREGTGIVVEWMLACPGTLSGATVGVAGLESGRSSVVLRVGLAEGRSFQTLLGPAQPDFEIPLDEGRFAVVRSYASLGFDHILSGIDHLLFVLCLVLLVGRGRKLLWTVTAFTVGHSITLALAVLELVVIPQSPIEAAIALSIVVLAAEIVRKQQGQTTAVERAPWLMAGAFGLLHGLGFAGALAEIGLPAGEIPLALFSFNVGIEAGQLFFVALVLLVWAGARRIPFRWPAGLLYVPAYSIGALAAFWFVDRSFFWLNPF